MDSLPQGSRQRVRPDTRINHRPSKARSSKKARRQPRLYRNNDPGLTFSRISRDTQNSVKYKPAKAHYSLFVALAVVITILLKWLFITFIIIAAVAVALISGALKANQDI